MLARQYEAQSVDTLGDTTLARNPEDSEWCRFVRPSATRLQEFDALKSVWKEKGKSNRQSKDQGKRKGKGKEKGKQGEVEGRNIRDFEHEMLLLRRKGSS